MAADKAEGDGVLRRDFPGGWAGDKQNAFTPAGRTPQQNEAYTYISKLLNWRKGNDAIAKGSFKHFITQNEVYVYERKYGNHSVVVFLNGSDADRTVDLTPYQEVLPTHRAYDLLNDRQIDLQTSLPLKGKGVLILEFGKVN